MTSNSDISAVIEACKHVDLLGLIEPTTRLRKVSAREWAGPCPKCGGTDRFRVNLDHGFFCRQCGNPEHWGDQIDFRAWLYGETFQQATVALIGRRPVSREALAQIQAERECAERERDAQEAETMAQARARLNTSRAWISYRNHLDDTTRALWRAKGIRDDWQDYYQLGYCPAREWLTGDVRFTSDSLTIPYLQYTAPGEYTCTGLKHRLLIDNAPGGKYRPETAGLGNQLYMPWYEEKSLNERVLIVEGEIKAMVTFAALWAGPELVLIDPTLSVVGIPGKTIKRSNLTTFENTEKIYILLDPDADSQARQLSVDLGVERCKIITLPEKVDDLITMRILNGEKLLTLLEG